MLEQFARMIGTIAPQNGSRYRLPCCGLSSIPVAVASLPISVLVRQNLARPPGRRKDIAENSTMMTPVAVKVAAALPGTNRRERAGLQRGYLPLFDGEIRDADETDTARGPSLRAGPFYAVVEILRLSCGERI